jgi:uncharacterized paraquat-inducible protein A
VSDLPPPHEEAEEVDPLSASLEGAVLAAPSTADLVIADLTEMSGSNEVVLFDVEALREGESPADPTTEVEILITEQSLIVDTPSEAVSHTRIDSFGSGKEVVVECPQCGLVCEGVDPRPTAAWFCPRCDYPLFLAAPVSPNKVPHEAVRRRLPGTDGREMMVAEPCWACGELNPPSLQYCARCGIESERPRLAPLEEAQPTVIDAPPLIYVARRWPLILTGVAAGAFATAVAVAIAIVLG